MKFYLAFILILLMANKVSSQTMTMLNIDSLHHALSMVKNDTSKVLIMANLTEGYRSSKPDSAIFYAQQALQLANKIQFPRGEVRALLGISVVMRELGNLPKALAVAMKAHKIAEAHHYVYEEAFSLVRIANVYGAFRNFSEGLNYLGKALEKVKPNDGQFLDIGIHVIAGNFLLQLNKLDSALYEADQALQLANKYKDSRFDSDIQNAYANIYNKKGESKLALKYYHQSMVGMLKLKDNRSVASLFCDVANFYKSKDQNDSAIYYAKQALEYAQALSYKNQEMRASSILSEIYEGSDSKLALHYYKLAASAKDSLYSTQKIQAMQALVFEEQERLKELDQEKLAYQNKVVQNGLLIGAILLLIVALILFNNNKQKQKANAILASTLLNLKSTQSQLIQSEKMASLGELTAGIAHEIQNPLNFVNNFSEVSNELIDEMNTELDKGDLNEAKLIAKDVKDNLEKINHHGKRADAIVKGMLQHSRISSGQKELTDINALCNEYLHLSYHGLRAKDKSFNAKLETDFDSSISKINVIPQDIGRVILNLINNAFYAVNEKNAASQLTGQAGPVGQSYQPTVRVSTRNTGDKIEISVKDNGNGIPDKIKEKIFQPFFTTKPTGQGTGLGLSLSYDIVKAHGGELNLETKEGEGTQFIIKLPIV